MPEEPILALQRQASNDAKPRVVRDALLFLSTWAAYVDRFGSDPEATSDLAAVGLKAACEERYEAAFRVSFPDAMPSVLIRESGLLEAMRTGSQEMEVTTLVGKLRLSRRQWRPR